MAIGSSIKFQYMLPNTPHFKPLAPAHEKNHTQPHTHKNLHSYKVCMGVFIKALEMQGRADLAMMKPSTK